MTYEDIVRSARAQRDRNYVRVERRGQHAVVTLDDPEKLNPLSAELTVQLHDELSALAAEPELRAIVLTGSDPAFSAGGDLRLMVQAAQEMLASPAGATDIWRWIRGQFGAVDGDSFRPPLFRPVHVVTAPRRFRPSLSTIRCSASSARVAAAAGRPARATSMPSSSGDPQRSLGFERDPCVARR